MFARGAARIELRLPSAILARLGGRLAGRTAGNISPPRLEPGNKGFAGLCLTAWLRRLKKEGLHVLSDGLTPLPKRETGLEPATPTLARWCSTN